MSNSDEPLSQQNRPEQGDNESPTQKIHLQIIKWSCDFITARQSKPLEKALKDLSKNVQGLAIIDLLKIVANFSLIFGLIGYCSGGNARRQQKHYQAWQVINSAVGREAAMGRKEAIEDLWADKVNLSDLDIHKARIPSLKLSPHYLSPHCLLSLRCPSVDMNNANLREVDLSEANLQGADLSKANLQGADLSEANLQGADLSEANLQGVWLIKAKLQKAKSLLKTDLEKANLSEVNLQGTDLSEAKLHNTIFISTDLRSTELTKEQIQGDKPPFICNSLMPEGLENYQDRDCDNDELPQLLMKVWPRNFKTIEDAKYYVKNRREQKKWD